MRTKYIDQEEKYWLGTKYIGSQKKQYWLRKEKNVIYFCMFKKLSWLCWTEEPFVIDRFLSASFI